MRLFLAVNFDRPMKDALVGIQNEWYDHGVRGSYTSEENLHLTLAFIGEYPDPQPVLDALAGVSFTPFPITLEGVGRFVLGLSDSIRVLEGEPLKAWLRERAERILSPSRQQ